MIGMSLIPETGSGPGNLIEDPDPKTVAKHAIAEIADLDLVEDQELAFLDIVNWYCSSADETADIIEHLWQRLNWKIKRGKWVELDEPITPPE